MQDEQVIIRNRRGWIWEGEGGLLDGENCKSKGAAGRIILRDSLGFLVVWGWVHERVRHG